MIYLDNSATTRTLPEAAQAALQAMTEDFYNPAAAYAYGARTEKRVNEARTVIAQPLHVRREEIIFTSCATESDNTAIRGTADWFGKDLKVITTAVEHPAVLQPVRRLKAQGYETVELPVNGVGQIDLDQLRAELASAKGPKLVSAMWANNETGTVFPSAKIAENTVDLAHSTLTVFLANE